MKFEALLFFSGFGQIMVGQSMGPFGYSGVERVRLRAFRKYANFIGLEKPKYLKIRVEAQKLAHRMTQQIVSAFLIFL